VAHWPPVSHESLVDDCQRPGDLRNVAGGVTEIQIGPSVNMIQEHHVILTRRQVIVAAQREAMFYDIAAFENPMTVHLLINSNVELNDEKAISQTERVGMQPGLSLLILEFVNLSGEGVDRHGIHQASMLFRGSVRHPKRARYPIGLTLYRSTARDAGVHYPQGAWLRLHGRCCAQFVAFRGPDGVAR